MFKAFKQIFSPTNKDLRKRLLFTIACLSFFCIGTNIPVPGTEEITQELGFLQLLDLMAGGGMQNFSIFALGVMPYITASIIMQLLQMDIIPYFKELKEEGSAGKQKINKIQRYMGIIFAFVQGYVFSIAFLGTNDPISILKTSVILTAGTALLLWIGDQITSKGIGNGVSLIIMAGIVQNIPGMFQTAFNSLMSGASSEIIGSLLFALFVLIYLAVVIGIIFIQQSERRIPIQYSNRTNSAYGAKQSFLPIKINSAGVIPVIFASTLITIPATIAAFTKNEGLTEFAEKWINYTTPTGLLIYILLIVFFGYFYTYLQMNPEEMAKNLNKSGGYVPGIRPGKDTENYISSTLSKITVAGAIFLVIVSITPIIFTWLSKMPASVSIGGTGLLIVVGVALDTFKQLESSLVSRSYKRKRTRI